MTNDPKTLRIAETITPGGGQIGITLAPGKKQLHAQSGRHDRDLLTDLDVIAKWNAAVVVTLVEPFELEEMQIPDIGREVRRRFMEWHHWPIPDVSVPGPEFLAMWPENSAKLRSLLATGANVLIHCKGGLGRAGMVSARLLVEMGVEPQEAMTRVRAVRPGAIETSAQERWVEQGRSASPIILPGDVQSVRDRAVGALVGLAVGDAIGTTIEFEPKPRHPVLTDMVGGGPFRLAAGQWTDDTAMALALADSLADDPDLDPTKLMSRFVDWYEISTFSCTGTCFDIGNATRDALERFKRTGNPLAGSKDPSKAGNGALMRLSPVAIRHWNDHAKLVEVARRTASTWKRIVRLSLAASSMFPDSLVNPAQGTGSVQ